MKEVPDQLIGMPKSGKIWKKGSKKYKLLNKDLVRNINKIKVCV